MLQTGQNPAPGFKNHPEHTITVEPLGKHVTVKSNGAVVASSDNALLLKEHVYPPVIYVPFADIDFGKLVRHRHQHALPVQGRRQLLEREGRRQGRDVGLPASL